MVTILLTGCKEAANCFPLIKEKIKTGDNPYQSCNKGDIITVSSKTYEHDGPYNVDDTHFFKIYADDISSYCSFSHPIVPLGITKADIQFYNGKDPKGPVTRFNQSWFSCVYIGENRDFR